MTASTAGLPDDTGRLARERGLWLAAHHDARTTGWWEETRLADIVGRIKQTALPDVVPVYLQEPTAWGTRTSDDTTAGHFTAAAAAAKRAGAAAWTFHQRVGFNLQSASFEARLSLDTSLRNELLGIRAAVDASPTWGVDTTDETEFYHLDALGSVRAVTDQNGILKARHEYFPFGEEWVAQPGIDRRRFTGKERDAETGLDYFGARYYRADLGRFTTVDPELDLKAALVEPQRWNRYAYVTNNPLKYTDPDGRNPLLITGGIGAAVYGGWAIYQNLRSGAPNWYNNVGFEAAKGFVVGATLGLAAPALGAADVSIGTATAALDAAAASKVASTALRFDPSTIFNDARKVEHMFKEVHQLELLGTRTEALSKIVDAAQKAYGAGALSMDKTGVFGQYLSVAGQKVFVQGRVIGDTLRIGDAWIPKI